MILGPQYANASLRNSHPYENGLFVQSLRNADHGMLLEGKVMHHSVNRIYRFIVKYVLYHEFDMFIDVAGLYFQHMARGNSALIQILGAYKVKTTINTDSLPGNKNAGGGAIPMG